MPTGIYVKTEEHKKHISEALKGRHLSEENKKKIGEAHKDKHYPKISEALKGKSNPHKGHSISKETKEKISEALWKGGRKMAMARIKSKHRSFDFIPLNEYFEGADAHHIDKVYVIYVPKEMHRSINHSVLKNKNMDEINALAMNYLNT